MSDSALALTAKAAVPSLDGKRKQAGEERQLATAYLDSGKRKRIREHVLTPEQWVHEAVQAAIDAMFELQDDGGEQTLAAVMAGMDAFRANMPPLTSPSRIKGYCACIAEGMRSNWLTKQQAADCLRIVHAAIEASRLRSK